MDIGGDGVEQNEGDQPSNLNISDVLAVLARTDPSYGAALVEEAQAGGGTQAEGAMSRPGAPAPPRPFVRIVEQPASKALRFRYICEGRSAGSIPGANSTQDRRTYPTIEIVGYTGKVIIVVSCVTKDTPYKPHPHNLVGRDHCAKGVCSMKMDVTPENTMVSFSNLGIQCVKKRDIGDALAIREGQRVDPFRTGFSHKSQPQSIDLNAVRLCFQVFMQGPDGECRRGLPPVVSDIIYDKKAMSDLHILRISRTSGSAAGGSEVILLCEKVAREETAVVLYEERGDGTAAWEANATIIMVHKQYAIAFTTPPYRDPHTTEHVKVFIQLKRVTGDERSNSIEFDYFPAHQDSTYLRRKRQKTLTTSLLQQIEQERATWNQEQTIKSEPSEKASPLHMGSSPLRFNPLEQVTHENPYQQWGSELNVPGPSNVNQYFNQDMQWTAPPYQIPMQSSMSPNMQARSPMQMSNMPVTSPNFQTISPGIQTMSPQRHAMQALSPHDMQAMSPHAMQAMSPHAIQAMSPHAMQAMSPQGQGHIMMSISPGLQTVNPQGQVMSPNHLTVDTDRCGVSPVMGHMSPNTMGHCSPNMVQQSMAQQPPQPMESNSTSLTNLLMDRGGENFNSGEIAAILGLRPGDLSDSLHRLSTSDLLNPAELQ